MLVLLFSDIEPWVWQGVQAVFDRFDVDKDGVLSLAELNEMQVRVILQLASPRPNHPHTNAAYRWASMHERDARVLLLSRVQEGSVHQLLTI